MSSVSNGNPIVLKWQNYTYDFKHKIEREREREQERESERGRERERESKNFTLHSAETYSEPFATFKQGGYFIRGNYFHKNLHLRCLKRF